MDSKTKGMDSKTKGTLFEQEFGRFMQKNLDYTNLKFNQWSRTDFASQNGYEIDISGKKVNVFQLKKLKDSERKKEKADKKKTLSIISFVVFIFLDVVFNFGADVDRLFGSVIPELAVHGFVIVIGIIAFQIYSQSKKVNKEVEKHKESLAKKTDYVWVECKNHNKNVNRDMVQKLHTSVKEHNKAVRGLKNPKQDDYEFKNMIYVSSKNFAHDAKHYAKQYKIKCYIKISDNQFEKLKL